MNSCRALVRAVRFVYLCLRARVEWHRRRRRGGVGRRDRADWLVRQAREVAGIIGLEISLEGGVLADADMVVANHLSYLDVVALAAVRRLTFVSKTEVARWPLIGGMLAAAGTVLVDRSRRGDVARAADALTAAVAPGVPVVVFPEGTTGDGTRVARFHSSLLAPAGKHAWRVLPVGIRYELPGGGSVAQEVCFCGTARFVPHFIRMLTHERIRVYLRFGPVVVGSDRKQLAECLRAEVAALSEPPVPERKKAPRGFPRDARGPMRAARTTHPGEPTGKCLVSELRAKRGL